MKYISGPEPEPLVNPNFASPLTFRYTDGTGCAKDRIGIKRETTSKEPIRSEFRSRKSDYEIRNKADSMRQNSLELFVDFKLRLESQSTKLRNPISEPSRVVNIEKKR